MPTINIPFDTDMGLTAKLLQIRETKQHQKIQALPIDIYIKNIIKVEQSLQALVEHTDKIPEHSKDLNHPIKTYVQALATLYDNIFRILKYSQELGTKKDNPNSISWIQRYGSIANKKFYEDTKIQQKLINKIDNKIKHDVVEIIEFKLQRTYLDRVTKIKSLENIEGFYINAAIGEKDLWGPDPDIHPNLDNITATAISYNFFILSTCYSLIHWLKTLSSILNKKNKDSEKSVNSSLTNILMMASQIKEEFFLDEYKKAYANILSIDDKYQITYPYQFKRNLKNRVYLGDSLLATINTNPRTGLANQKLPYMNLDSKHMSL